MINLILDIQISKKRRTCYFESLHHFLSIPELPNPKK